MFNLNYININKTIKILKSKSLFGFFICDNNLTAREIYVLRAFLYNFDFSIIKLSKDLSLHFFNISNSGFYFYTNHFDFFKYFKVFLFFTKTKFKIYFLFFKVLYNIININFFINYIIFFNKILLLQSYKLLNKFKFNFSIKLNNLKFYLFKFNLYNMFAIFYIFKLKLFINLFHVNN